MCKAGFAGDDAPRAVFRKSTPLSLPKLLIAHTWRYGLWGPVSSRHKTNAMRQLPLSVAPVTMGKYARK